MHKKFYVVILSLMLVSCGQEKKQALFEGIWLGELQLMDEEILPFTFRILKSKSGTYTMEIYNAEEIIEVDEIDINKDSIRIGMPVFEGYIAGVFSKNTIKGSFIKEDVDRVVPFMGTFDKTERFTANKPSIFEVSGTWETEFSPNTPDRYLAKGIFSQNGTEVTGTFRTTTGDYRFLEGVISGDSLKLSTFDGSHAYLFLAAATDSTLMGTFYSGNHFKEPFVARRNESFELPDADSLTFLKEGYEEFKFSFPDSQGNMVSLDDERFKNKVVLVQILGSWCPNCLDETKFFVEYLEGNAPADLEIVGLAFEYAKTEKDAFKRIQRLIDRIGVKYPILLAQYGSNDKDEAQRKLPMLNHVLSYPTTIYIDKMGSVRKIHTGFNGPATGEKFMEFKSEFKSFIDLLLAEKDTSD